MVLYWGKRCYNWGKNGSIDFDWNMYTYTFFSILPHQAKEEALRGNLTAAQQKANISLCLNISAVVCGILFYVIIIGLIVGINASVASSRYYYSYSHG